MEQDIRNTSTTNEETPPESGTRSSRYGLGLALILLGCAPHRQGPPREIDLESCVVQSVDQGIGPDHRVVCDDGTILVLQQLVPIGVRLTYTSYYEDEDSTTLHGYLKGIQ